MNYVFKVTSENPDNRTMEGVYTREGYEPVLVGLPMLVEGEDLSALAARYAPVSAWEEQDRARKPLVSHAGVEVGPPAQALEATRGDTVMQAGKVRIRVPEVEL